MRYKHVALKTLTVECGPAFFRMGEWGERAQEIITKVGREQGIALKFLVYSREELPHAIFYAGREREHVGKLQRLYQNLNAHKIPFNLALNGSPKRFRSIPLDAHELDVLHDVQETGARNGIQNSVTIADNELVPQIRKELPGLEIIGSCISAAFRPNQLMFQQDFPEQSKGDEFLVNYYRYLYGLYDKVVPLAQITTPNFLRNFQGEKGLLRDQTIVFLDLHCGSQSLGRCTAHYNSASRYNDYNNIYTIPSQFLVKPEGNHLMEAKAGCPESFASCCLINRPSDLMALIRMGIRHYKIPERRGQRLEDFELLVDAFAHPDHAVEDFPERNQLRGYSPRDIKWSYRKNYPPQIWPVLQEFSWPPIDGPYGDGYCGHTAHGVRNKLHAIAETAWRRRP